MFKQFTKFTHICRITPFASRNKFHNQLDSESIKRVLVTGAAG